MDDPPNEDLDGVIFSTRFGGDQRDAEILMEQYKLFVETSERLVARRQVVNTFFLSVNALALSALGMIAKEALENPVSAFGILATSIAAMLLCIAWMTLVHSYAQLNRGKFAVIDRLEERLPAALFRGEWVALGKGEKLNVYKPFTATESMVSKIFIVIYALIALFTLGWLVASCM